MFKIFTFLLLNLLFFTQNKISEIIIDSNLTLEASLSGKKIPKEIKSDICLISVQYYGFDDNIHQGQILVHKSLESEVEKIFSKLLDIKFPIEKVIPIVKYNWSDEKSMEDNNSSGFNYRFIKGTKRLSNHAFGKAIDINPLLNPYIKKDSVEPEGAIYNPNQKGTITSNSEVVKIFKNYGWDWGGDWNRGKDYQHFEKIETK